MKGIKSEYELDDFLKIIQGHCNYPLNYFQAIRNWVKINNTITKKLSSNNNYLAVRYEDIVYDPKKSISKILRMIGLDFDERILSYFNFEHHLYEGNRMRMQGKPIEYDKDYLEKLSTNEWFFGTLNTLPLIIKYGYSIFR